MKPLSFLTGTTGGVRRIGRITLPRSRLPRSSGFRQGFLIRVLEVAVFMIFLALNPNTARAGGNCLIRPEAFQLQSDTVRWSMKIDSGAECIQGLRWSTIMIDQISIVEPPKLGRLSLQGPSFRYFSNPGARGADSFKISIVGSSLRKRGVSSIEVDVIVQ